MQSLNFISFSFLHGFSAFVVGEAERRRSFECLIRATFWSRKAIANPKLRRFREENKKMNMVEPNHLDGFLDVIPGDKDFPEDEPLDLLDFFDFPMESLEDGGEWDASNSHCLGPIPSDAFLSLPPVPQDNVLPATNASVGGTGQTHQESGSFQIHSPVSVLDNSSGSCSVGKSLPIKPDVFIPVRTRSKRARPSNLNPWFVMPPISSARKMIRSKKSKEKKKKVSPTSFVKVSDDSFQQADEEFLNASDATVKKEGSQQRSVAVKKCTHCEVTKTPQWREGPMGPKTLCNACGVRYRSGRLFPEYRPAASPTFVPTLHSNSHKKVIEMRKKATVPETAIPHDVPVSPPPEFVPMGGSLFDFIY